MGWRDKISKGIGSLASRYRDDDDTISWTNVGKDALMASTAYAALNPNDSETIGNFMGTNQQGPVGYMGGIPNYTATRSLVDDAFTQTNPATSTEAATARRPGSMGRQYFTDTTYAANANEPIMGQGIKTPEEIAAEEEEAEANQAIYESLMGDAFDARLARGTPNALVLGGGENDNSEGRQTQTEIEAAAAATKAIADAAAARTGGDTSNAGTGGDTSNAGLVTTFVNTLDLVTGTDASNQANIELVNTSGYTLAEIATALKAPLEDVQTWFDYYSTGPGSVGYVAPLTQAQIDAQNAATINSGAKTALIASGFIDNGDGTLTSPSGVINRPNSTTGQFEGDVFGIYDTSGNLVSSAATFDSLVSSMVSGNSLSKSDWITLSNSGKTVAEITAALNARNANTTIENVTASIEAAFSTDAADEAAAAKIIADKVIADEAAAADKAAADKVAADKVAADPLDPYERSLVTYDENFTANADGTVTDIASGFKFDYVNGDFVLVTDDAVGTLLNSIEQGMVASGDYKDNGNGTITSTTGFVYDNETGVLTPPTPITATTITAADDAVGTLLNSIEQGMVASGDYKDNGNGTITSTTGFVYDNETGVLTPPPTITDTTITAADDDDDASTIITANTSLTDYVATLGNNASTTLTEADYLAMGNSGFTLAQIAAGLSLRSSSTVTVEQLEANIAAAGLSPEARAVNAYITSNDLAGRTPTDAQWIAIGGALEFGSLDIAALAAKFGATADQITAEILAAAHRSVVNNSVVQNAQGGIVSGYAQGGGIQSQGYYLGGPTDGMADQVPATIDNSQPAALSDGEFVIPADVVSHLGNGNSEAGAENLYDMMERLRTDRTGNPNQGRQINPNEYLA